MRKPKIPLTDEIKALDKRPQPHMIVQERSYKLITPLFGGSAEPGVVDKKMPIRGSEIRGHLRFWWRATRGGQFTDLDEMRKAEGKIWGTATKPKKDEERPLPVQIAVQIDQTGSPDNPFDHENQRSRPNPASVVPAYAAFPLQRTDEELKAVKPPPPRTVQKDVSFTLRITFPEEHRQDVQAALWAWETFGGIGARTRRGFGALHCTQCSIVNGDETKSAWVWSYASADMPKKIADDLQAFVVDGKFPENVPYLSKNPKKLKITPLEQRADEAWRYLVYKLQDFRQNRPKGKYGRSNWPEPDAIRRLTGQSHFPTDKDSRKFVYDNIDKFPRADFGLPIVFKFKDDDTRNPRNRRADPPKTTLEGKDKESSRLASPLILRPVVCDGQYVGLATVLEGTSSDKLPQGLALKEGDIVLASDLKSRLSSSEAKTISQKHKDLRGNANILQAFLNTLYTL
ncbi:MAG: type III-B CRISPR module RAMP protein Cmr1 [Chloroflexi bacterium]|nr:type III-B CRISPR module RAMP protein Cmr1 [Chloroflexota bacterium]